MNIKTACVILKKQKTAVGRTKYTLEKVLLQYTYTNEDIMNRNIINRIIKDIVIVSLDSNGITNISISMQLYRSTNQSRQFGLI